MIIKNNKASALALSFVLIMIVTAFIAAVSGTVMHFINFTRSYEQAQSLSALLEAGIQRAVWSLQNGLPISVGLSETENITINSVSISITITRNTVNKYTITSAAQNKTLTASYENNKIQSWR
jgi:hypothetical protein